MRENYPVAETNPEALLDAFGKWRDANLTDLPSADVAHLFTARDLVDGMLGAARRWSACGDDAGDGYAAASGHFLDTSVMHCVPRQGSTTWTPQPWRSVRRRRGRR